MHMTIPYPPALVPVTVAPGDPAFDGPLVRCSPLRNRRSERSSNALENRDRGVALAAHDVRVLCRIVGERVEPGQRRVARVRGVSVQQGPRPSPGSPDSAATPSSRGSLRRAADHEAALDVPHVEQRRLDVRFFASASRDRRARGTVPITSRPGPEGR